MAKAKSVGSSQKVSFGKKSHKAKKGYGPKEQKPKRYRGQKLMYNEFDEAETYIKGKVKVTKINKPKKKETKPVRGKKNLSDDWE
jgi:hypothetical protein